MVIGIPDGGGGRDELIPELVFGSTPSDDEATGPSEGHDFFAMVVCAVSGGGM